MLMRSRAVTAPKMPDSEFLDRLRQTPVGREVMTAREQTLAEKRRVAAENVTAAYAAEAENLQSIDAELARAKKDIETLSAKLQTAQERHGALTNERGQVQNTRLQIVRKSLAYLQATSPTELLELASLVRLTEHSARFQMSLRQSGPIPIGTDPFVLESAQKKSRAEADANSKRAAALLRRAREVGTQVQQMLMSPAVDLESVGRLREYLNPPAELNQQQGPGWTEPAQR